MSKRFLRVAKVGGSLFDVPELPAALRCWLEAQPGITVLIAGGGPLADSVRAADQRFQLGEEICHELCLKTMGLSADILAALLPEASLWRARDVTREEIARAAVPLVVMDPGPLMLQASMKAQLPSTWDVTSDSIAACIADLIEAQELVLFKSIDLPPNKTRSQASELGLVDAFFPEATAQRHTVRWVNLRRTPAVERPL